MLLLEFKKTYQALNFLFSSEKCKMWWFFLYFGRNILTWSKT